MNKKNDNRSDQDLLETTLFSETLHQGAFLTLKRDTVSLPNGLTATREFVAHPGAVAIIPLFDDGQVLIERQFRYPLNQVFIEFPAGKLNPADQRLADHTTDHFIDHRASDNADISFQHLALNDLNAQQSIASTNQPQAQKVFTTARALACAKRELREETGYSADHWTFFSRIHPLIAYSTEFIDLFLAQGLHEGPTNLDHGEFIHTEKASVSQLLAWVKDGTISDAKTIIATFWLEKWLTK